MDNAEHQHFAWLARSFGRTDYLPLSPDDLEALSGAGEYVEKYPGTHLFKQGAPATAAYVIQRGQVELYRTRNEGRRVVGRVGEGGVIGDIAMFQNQPYISSAKAIGTMVAYKLDRQKLLPMLLDHRIIAITALLVLAAACGESASPGSQTQEPIVKPTPSDTSLSPLSLEAGTLPSGPSALQGFDHDEFPAPLVDTSLIISGGPQPDGIPPLDNPRFLSVIDNLELLDDAEPVVALEIDGDARAYPVRVMIWHEIVNDVVGGLPVSVTYCPLCNSATTYIRRINGVETTFGTSGLLYLSALVMYDRATESLWTHFDGKAVAGMLTGRELEPIASPLLSWEDFRLAYPDGLVLDETQTGFSRDYGRNPYVGYDDADTRPFLFRGPLDDRALAKERIVGIELDGESRAYLLSQISGTEARATNVRVGGQDVVIFWKPGQASALDSSQTGTGRDVGSVGVFRAEVSGRSLTFVGGGERFSDGETGSSWLITGEAVSGPLAGTTLDRLPHLDTFWFAWATYRPDTILVTDVPDEN